MPYISEKDKERLASPLFALKDALKKKIAALKVSRTDLVAEPWGYLQYAARRTLVETSLNAAEQYQGKRGLRYWLIVDQAGICMNIGFELYARVLSKMPGGASPYLSIPMDSEALWPAPEDAADLDRFIDGLVAEISQISGPKDVTGGYDYDGAYCGMDNYSMTELAPRLIMELCDEMRQEFGWIQVERLVHFWFAMVAGLYTTARRYEDEQMKKNGDVAVYELMLRRLPRNEK